MSFQSFMEACLPPVDGRKPHISGSKFYTSRPDARHARIGYIHGAVDFNYVGGQAFNLPNKYPVHCPFAGEVVFTGGSYGTVRIKDSKGFIHGWLHNGSIRVKVGESVTPGKMISLMSNTGPTRYDVHVHYQIQNPKALSNDKHGGLIDPVSFWDGNGQIPVVPDDDQDDVVNVQGGTEGYGYVEPETPSGFINEYKPAQPGESSESGVGFALWTNRVPQHEPWARTMMGDTENANTLNDECSMNVNHYPQFTEDNEAGRKLIGKADGEKEYVRGPFWRR